VCLKSTVCYTERQREEVDKNDNWACPDCANLNDRKDALDPLTKNSYT